MNLFLFLLFALSCCIINKIYCIMSDSDKTYELLRSSIEKEFNFLIIHSFTFNSFHSNEFASQDSWNINCAFIEKKQTFQDVMNRIHHDPSCLILREKFIEKNNHSARITNFEKEHYKQDRVNLEDDWMMMNCMNCSNADSKTIASDVDSLQENRDAKSKCSRNDEENIANIIDLLIKISTLEKEKSKDHSWKEIALKLIWHLWLDSEEKHHTNQNAFIAKNV